MKELFEEILNHCDSIIETCQRTTSGNYMHNNASNRFSAKMIKQCVELIKAKEIESTPSSKT
jgi:hypothetical protein